ncbi:MAG: 3'(2'),5'-bisphosphate nucleotidase CysQ [Verrucomicrobia bacterium]|nr:3'(2'),5'-bisphosphate nucleotidase CysQ [Kiritimatiellia bacterium]MCP5487639.1 3'(2'),5'-bisphosphate nucleotidase CysQ [Verrucomicrobiota bacterium]
MNNPLFTTAYSATLQAGHRILEIYGSDFTAMEKADRSPLTEADLAAHELLVHALGQTGLPVLSEESAEIPYAERSAWTRFWLVDPLDGTKEFIKRNGEFTVNVALIDQSEPILGLVYAPVLDVLYLGWTARFDPSPAAWRLTDPDPACPVFSGPRATLLPDPALARGAGPLRVVASRSHLTGETRSYIEQLEQAHGPASLVSKGSSLKLCMVAEGAADVYPRLAPTMEWDTAAGQAVVEAAGGAVVVYDAQSTIPESAPLRYNRENLLNPFFVVASADFRFA